jgi:hypothetical protein
MDSDLKLNFPRIFFLSNTEKNHLKSMIPDSLMAIGISTQKKHRS